MIFKNILAEWKYYTKTPWSLNDVGNFWDNVKKYDDINSKFYTYDQRFSNSYFLLKKKINSSFNPKKILDIQTRTGNGSIFWHKYYKKSSYYLADFSKNFLNKAKRNLKKKSISHKYYLVKNYRLPFNANNFDFILCYETIEHIYKYDIFISEIARVVKKNGIIILTTPNISWEIIHWITAVIGYNHSEGPHRFISKKKIDGCLKKNKLKVLAYNTSIFLPFNNKSSIAIDKFLMKYLPKKIKEFICLRHSYILKKI